MVHNTMSGNASSNSDDASSPSREKQPVATEQNTPNPAASFYNDTTMNGYYNHSSNFVLTQNINQWFSDYPCDANQQLSTMETVSSHDDLLILVQALFEWFSICREAWDAVNRQSWLIHLRHMVNSVTPSQQEGDHQHFFWDTWCSRLLSDVLNIREDVYLKVSHQPVSVDAMYVTVNERINQLLKQLKDLANEDLSENPIKHQLVRISMTAVMDVLRMLVDCYFTQVAVWLSIASQCEKLKQIQNNQHVKPVAKISFFNHIIGTCGVSAFAYFMADPTRTYYVNFSWIAILSQLVKIKSPAKRQDHQEPIKLLYSFFLMSIEEQQQAYQIGKPSFGSEIQLHLTQVAIWYMSSLTGDVRYDAQQTYHLVLFISTLLEANERLETDLGSWVLQQMKSLSAKKQVFSKSQMFFLNAHRLIFSLAFNSMTTKSLTVLAKQLFKSLIHPSRTIIGSQGERVYSVLSLFDQSLKQFHAAGGDSFINRIELFTYLSGSHQYCHAHINPSLSPSPS